MKKILFVLLLFKFCDKAHAQSIDTSYYFEPPVFKKIVMINKLDTVCKNGYCVKFEKQMDLKYLNVSVFKNSQKKSEGRYFKSQ